jgi:integrase
MARTIRDKKLETRAARLRLPPGRKPHFKTLIPGKLHLGYRRKRADTPGQWIVRRYIDDERDRTAQYGLYRIAPLGLADDFQDAGPGREVLTFADAQQRALSHKPSEMPRKALTVADVVTEYVAWLRAHRATGQDAEWRAAKLILPQLGRVKIAELTTVQLNRWRDALAEAPPLVRTKVGTAQRFGAAPTTAEARRARRATANRTITILKAALNKAFEEGRVNDDVEWRRLKPFENVNAARPGYLTIEEAQRLINSADGDTGFRDLVHAALQTGARYGELCALRVRDFHRGKVAIRRSKSGKPRDIVLTDEGTAFFEALTVGRDHEALMFVRPDGGAWLAAAQARPMREACARAGINPPIGFHQLRHTWASLAVMAGVPLMIVARNLGHASIAMVEKHYGHLSASYIDDALRAGAPKFGAVEQTNVRPLKTASVNKKSGRG